MTDSTRQVVLHVADAPADLERAIASAQALREEMPDCEVRIIVNGPALAGVTGETPVVAPDGVRVAACAIGLARRGDDPSTLRPGITSVPGASAALAQAQFEGAAYLRV